jgi:dolichyl-phosphate-mannose--protein O-mannosyl transferase
MKSVRYVGMVLTRGIVGSPGFKLVWNFAKMYDSIARIIAACTVVVIMNDHVQVVFGRYILLLLGPGPGTG